MNPEPDHESPPVAPAAGAGEAVPSGGQVPTPQEQMEQFEEELKETDWGHQPC